MAIFGLFKKKPEAGDPPKPEIPPVTVPQPEEPAVPPSPPEEPVPHEPQPEIPNEAPEPAPVELPQDEPLEAPTGKVGWFQRLKKGLAKSKGNLWGGVMLRLTGRKLDDALAEELEESLITADFGPKLAAQLIGELRRERFGQDVTEDGIRQFLAVQLTQKLAPYAKEFAPDASKKPFVVMMVGANGSGKTTTAGKLASQFKAKGLKVRMAAGDTFRAAAVEQLKVWGERADVPVTAKGQGADPAGLAFDALREAQAAGDDLLLLDTAGRLHNKNDLMAELQKVVRALQKIDPTAPHACWLVLDATFGQNAIAQVETFREMTPLSGLVLTKLDGSTKGGIAVPLVEAAKLPIHYLGVGEGIGDLQPFTAEEFVEALLGKD